MSLSANITNLWRLGEASGNRADSVGSVALPASGTPGNRAGKEGLALDSSASNFLEVSDETLDIVDAGATFGLWFNADALASAGKNAYLLADWVNPGGLNCCVCLDENGVLSFQAGGRTAAWGGTVATGSWYSVIGLSSRSGGTVTTKISVNGGAFVTSSGTNTFQAGDTFRIGGAHVFDLNGEDFNGAIDYVVRWSDLKTVADSAEFYNSGAGKFAPYRGRKFSGRLSTIKSPIV